MKIVGDCLKRVDETPVIRGGQSSKHSPTGTDFLLCVIVGLRPEKLNLTWSEAREPMTGHGDPKQIFKIVYIVGVWYT